MTVPAIQALPPAPTRANGPADFTAKADTLLAAWPTFVTESNGLAVYTDGRATTADQRATAAADSATQSAQAVIDARLARDAAQAVASFKGSWSSLSGALSMPATVMHNGQIWSLLVSLGSVAASEPGITADWVVQGGLDASKTTNFTASRNSRYWLGQTVTVTLPASAGMPAGTFVELTKAQAATPIIQTTDGALIGVGAQSDTSVTYNLAARLLFVFTGTTWEI
jgi:hypothetical protein